jgi:diguanylate cyclase (GGDEF)-like protein
MEEIHTRMFAQLNNLLDKSNRDVLQVLALVVILLLGVVDYWTGPEIAFSTFYLLPLAAIAWKVGARAGIGSSLLAAATWGTADMVAYGDYGSVWIPLWNTTTRLLVFVVVVTLLSSLRSALALQEILAASDSLTGVANARTFDRVAANLTRDKMKHPFTIAYLDLDNFKSINDTFGHSGGDDVLQAVARALDDNTRSTDLVARVGGDEFALLLSATDSEAAAELVTQLVSRTQKALSNLPMDVTFSAGAATFLVPPHDIDEMVGMADELMYEAKRDQKGSFRHLVVRSGEDIAVADVSPRRAHSAAQFLRHKGSVAGKVARLRERRTQ